MKISFRNKYEESRARLQQELDIIMKSREEIIELSDTIAKISKIAKELGDWYTQDTLIANLEWLVDDADYHLYNDTLWSWVKYLEEEYKEDETEEYLEN